ncbi:MAG TPA: ATP-binding protein [Chitinophagales bacterium]|nr:ATP-binding protein [Chitinophagales bacterium]
MQNAHIRLLISLMAVSLVGLVTLQYKWIKEAIAVKEARFEQTVNESLDKVAYKIEKLETAQMLWTRFGKVTGAGNGGVQITIAPNNPETTSAPDSVNANSIVLVSSINIKQNTGGAFLGVVLAQAPAGFGPGVLVTQVIDNSPALSAGLKEGDIITAIDSIKVFSAADIQQLVANHTAGDEVKIRYKRPRFFKQPALSHNSDKVVAPPNNMTAFKNQLTQQRLNYSDTDLTWLENMDTTALATLANRMEKSFEQIYSLAVEMMLINKPIQERIDPQTLEHTLTQTLIDAGIDIPFHYCLKTGESCNRNNIVYSNVKQAEISEKLHNSQFSKTLGQNAVFAQKAELMLYFPNQQNYIWNSSIFMLGSSVLFNLLILGVFAFTMHTIIQQKKLSDMKTDFINNMTHELKTPISTIKLACEMLTDDNLPKTTNSINRYATIIQEENFRLQDHVEKVLQYARLEKGNLKLNLATLDMHDILSEAVHKTSLSVNKLQGTIQTLFEAKNYLIQGDAMHLTNVVYNLLDNAVKYAKPDVPPQITVATCNVDNHLVITVTDNGIGMSKETLSKIFDQFYRVPTGNIHNVKGFGLGLSYAKLMTEQHGGAIKVASKLGKGSSFEVQLPLEAKIKHT